MIEVKTKLRRWGNSFGIVLPITQLKRTRLKEGEEITALILEKKKVDLKKLFGAHKFRKSSQHMMREIDQDLYHD